MMMSNIPQEDLIVKNMFSEIETLKETHPEFFAYFEDVDPDTAPRAELVDLMASAPNDQVKFFLFGKFTMRLTLAAVTGREFK
jgi:hypothetical protein